MDVIAAFREVGSYRGAAEICGTTHETVKLTLVGLLPVAPNINTHAHGHARAEAMRRAARAKGYAALRHPEHGVTDLEPVVTPSRT